MPESAKIKQSIQAFKDYLSEAIQGKNAIILGIDKNIYLQGVICHHYGAISLSP